MDPLTFLLMSGGLALGGGAVSAMGSDKANRDMMKFNARQAALNRSWMEKMSNSAHQREIKDLRKAGLNPILSAGGQGASVGSSSAASVGHLANVGEAAVEGASTAMKASNDAVEASAKLDRLVNAETMRNSELANNYADQRLKHAQAGKFLDDVKDGPLRRELLKEDAALRREQQYVASEQGLDFAMASSLKDMQYNEAYHSWRSRVEEAEEKVKEIRARTGEHMARKDREELNYYLDIVNTGTDVVKSLSRLGFKPKR